MDDKIFNLLEKVYGEMQEMKENMATKQDIVGLENKIDTNHKALYDGYKLVYEKLTLLDEKVEVIDNKVDRHDTEIRVIRSEK